MRTPTYLLVASCLFSAQLTLSTEAQSKIKSEASIAQQGGGSDGYRRANDPKGVFYSMTDRGPNVDCTDALNLLNIDPCPQDEDGKVFVQPDYQPRIFKWKWLGKGEPQLLETILIHDAEGQPISGVTNPYFAPELPYGPGGESLTLDPSGIDPEGLVVMADGSFWISEEYGPSLLHISPKGQVLERWVPSSLLSYYKEARYPVVGKLPAIFGFRRSNRGFESLALSPDGKTLLVANQSALAHPSSSVAKKSRQIRILTIAMKGSEAKDVNGMYAYQFDEAESFGQDAKVSDLKISAMLFKKGQLLIQERTDEAMKIFKVTLKNNILDTAWIEADTTPSFEESAPKKLFAKKKLLWDSQTLDQALALKIESVIDWQDDELLLLNDDDFGVTGESSRIYRIELPAL